MLTIQPDKEDYVSADKVLSIIGAEKSTKKALANLLRRAYANISYIERKIAESSKAKEKLEEVHLRNTVECERQNCEREL